MRNTSTHKKHGFTLIEAIIFLFLFTVITLAFYQTWQAATSHIVNVRNRLGAVAVANQQIEIIRSIIFDDIGTTTGIPTGSLQEYQTLSVNNSVYTVHTLVQFVDDATDGTLSAGTDLAPNDYKKVTVTVSWGSGGPSEQVSTVSLFSLDGVESVADGTGILSVNVLDTSGNGVSGATVTITNGGVSPAVNVTATTDSNGNLSFPGAPESVQGYAITVSKSGYFSNQSYPPYPTSTFNPVNVHATVVAGSLTATSLVIDKISSIAITTEDPFGAPVPDIDFDITGGLVIGTNASDGTPVYEYTAALVTDGNGRKDISNRTTGDYAITLDASETTRKYIRLVPSEATFGSINLLPDTNQAVDFVVADKALSSALITAIHQTNGTAVAGASVRLVNTTLAYDATVTTDIYGQAFFPETNTPLLAGTYDVTITASGYSNATGTLTVAGDRLEQQTFQLTPL